MKNHSFVLECRWSILCSRLCRHAKTRKTMWIRTKSYSFLITRWWTIESRYCSSITSRDWELFSTKQSRCSHWRSCRNTDTYYHGSSRRWAIVYQNDLSSTWNQYACSGCESNSLEKKKTSEFKWFLFHFLFLLRRILAVLLISLLNCMLVSPKVKRILDTLLDLRQVMLKVDHVKAKSIICKFIFLQCEQEINNHFIKVWTKFEQIIMLGSMTWKMIYVVY